MDDCWILNEGMSCKGVLHLYKNISVQGCDYALLTLTSDKTGK